MQYSRDVKELWVTIPSQRSSSDDTACPAHAQGQKLQGTPNDTMIFKIDFYTLFISIIAKGTREIGGQVKMCPFQI